MQIRIKRQGEEYEEIRFNASNRDISGGYCPIISYI